MCDLFIGTLIYIFKLGISKSVNQVHHLQLQSLFFSTLHFMITIIIFFSSFFAVVQKTVKTILLKAFILYTTLPIYVTYLRPFILHCCLGFSGNTCDSDHYLKCTSVEKPLQLTLQTVFFNSYISR